MENKADPKSQDLIESLERQINELKARWPAHSIPAAMMEQLDELEEALAAEIRRRDKPGQLQR